MQGLNLENFWKFWKLLLPAQTVGYVLLFPILLLLSEEIPPSSVSSSACPQFLTSVGVCISFLAFVKA